MPEYDAKSASASDAQAPLASPASPSPETAARNKRQTDTAMRTRAAVVGGDGPATASTGGLPGDLRAKLEQKSGLDLSAVRVHRNSPAPAELGAHAFAKGNDIHLGPGQDQHLEHEAWHVVQQKQGRVKADDKGHNDDAALEREADRGGGAHAPANAPSEAIQCQKATLDGSGKELEVEPTGNDTSSGKAIYRDANGALYEEVANTTLGPIVRAMPNSASAKVTGARRDEIEAALPKLFKDYKYVAAAQWMKPNHGGNDSTTSLEETIKLDKGVHRQGWKLHVAARPDQLDKVLAACMHALRDEQIMHKLVSSLAHYEANVGTQVGKALTIYPNELKDVEHLCSVVTALDRAIGEALADSKDSKPEVSPDELPLGTSGYITTRFGQVGGPYLNEVYKDQHTGQKDDRSRPYPSFVTVPPRLLELVPEEHRGRFLASAKSEEKRAERPKKSSKAEKSSMHPQFGDLGAASSGLGTLEPPRRSNRDQKEKSGKSEKSSMHPEFGDLGAALSGLGTLEPEAPRRQRTERKEKSGKSEKSTMHPEFGDLGAALSGLDTLESAAPEAPRGGGRDEKRSAIKEPRRHRRDDAKKAAAVEAALQLLREDAPAPDAIEVALRMLREQQEDDDDPIAAALRDLRGFRQ